MTGITETKEFAGFLIKLINGVGESLSDGRVTVKDTLYLLPAAVALPRAFQGIEKIPAEVKDLTAEEAAALWRYLFDNLEVVNEEDKKTVENIFNYQVASLRLIVELFQRRKNNRLPA